MVQLRREHPRRLRSMVPAHVWALVERYGLAPREVETEPGEINRRP